MTWLTGTETTFFSRAGSVSLPMDNGAARPPTGSDDVMHKSRCHRPTVHMLLRAMVAVALLVRCVQGYARFPGNPSDLDHSIRASVGHTKTEANDHWSGAMSASLVRQDPRLSRIGPVFYRMYMCTVGRADGSASNPSTADDHFIFRVSRHCLAPERHIDDIDMSLGPVISDHASATTVALSLHVAGVLPSAKVSALAQSPGDNCLSSDLHE
nr:hypothetical protein CFP56_36459 [Quercus suber]